MYVGQMEHPHATRFLKKKHFLRGYGSDMRVAAILLQLAIVSVWKWTMMSEVQV